MDPTSRLVAQVLSKVPAHDAEAAKAALQEINISGDTLSLILGGVFFISAVASYHAGTVKERRCLLDKEIRMDVSTFVIPNDIESRDLTKKQQFVRAFYQLAQEHPETKDLFNLKLTAGYGQPQADFYTTQAFFKDTLIPSDLQTNAGNERLGIHALFKSETLYVLEEINKKFVQEWYASSYIKSFSTTYSDDIRAARMVLISVSNLLWHLACLSDPMTQKRMGSAMSASICIIAKSQVSRIIDLVSGGFTYFKTPLIQYLQSVNTSINGIHEAYVEDALKTLDWVGLEADIAHINAQIIEILFGLIYPEKKKRLHDGERLTSWLARIATTVGNILITQPSIVGDFFSDCLPLNKELAEYVNHPPTTFIDALLIFVSLDRHKRTQLLSRLGKTYALLAKELQFLQDHYLAPLNVSPNILLAHLIPIMALFLSTNQFDIDSSGVESILSSRAQGKTSYAQLNLINQSVSKTSYFQDHLEALVSTQNQTWSGVLRLMSQRFLPAYRRFVRLSQLITALANLMKQNQLLLRQKNISDFLIQLFDKLEQERDTFSKVVAEFSRDFASQEQNQCAEAMIFLNQLNPYFTHFKTMLLSLKDMVLDVSFRAKQNAKLVEDIALFEAHYCALFQTESGLKKLVIEPGSTSLCSETSPEVVSVANMFALSQLARECYSSLSYLSYYGRKGLVLKDFIDKLEQKQSMSPQAFRKAVLELVRITAAYHKTSFFQARYGETRTANRLLTAMQDPLKNERLLLSEILFEAKQHRCDAAELGEKLRVHQQSQTDWETSGEQLHFAVL